MSQTPITNKTEIESRFATNFEQSVRLVLEKMPISPPSPALGQKILLIVDLKKKRLIFLRLWTSAVFALASIFCLILIWQSEWSVIFHSETSKLFSLLFSDTAVVAQFWREYLLSLLQSLPFGSVVIIFSLLLAAVISFYTGIRAGVSLKHRKIKHA